MFDSIRGRLHSVQENLSASFQRLSTSDSNRSLSKLDLQSCQVNLNAGGDLLDKYQTQWTELHSLAHDNARLAQDLDADIGKLHKKCEKKWTDISQLCAVVVCVPQILHSLASVSEKLDRLESSFSSVEKSLLALEDLIEVQELQERQLDHRFQLALYKEKKLSELENVRVMLAKEHAEKLNQHELRQQRLLRERQETFEKQFKQDLETYKQTHDLPKITTNKNLKNEASLEEIVLDEDANELNDFLQDNRSASEISEPASS